MNRKSHFLALSDYTGDELNELLNITAAPSIRLSRTLNFLFSIEILLCFNNSNKTEFSLIAPNFFYK